MHTYIYKRLLHYVSDTESITFKDLVELMPDHCRGLAKLKQFDDKDFIDADLYFKVEIDGKTHDQLSAYCLTIYRYANIVSFSKYC